MKRQDALTLHNPHSMTQETQVRGCPLCHIMESHRLLNVRASSFIPAARKFEHQDRVFAKAFMIVQEAIAQRAFPAASIAVTHRGRLVALKALGTFTYNEIKAQVYPRVLRERMGILKSSPPNQLEGAPISRVLCEKACPELAEGWARRRKSLHTLRPSLLNKSSSHHSDGNVYERGLLDLDAPVSAIVPEFIQDAAKNTAARK